MSIEAMKQALEALECFLTADLGPYSAAKAITTLRAAIKQAEKQEPVAQAWAEGYRAGIDDERTSEANIGIAGMGMKVEPARNNPYRATPPAAHPCRSPYCECDVGKCTHPGFYDARHGQFTHAPAAQPAAPTLNECRYPDCKCPTETPCLKGLTATPAAAQRKPLTWDQVNEMWLEAINVQARLPSHVVYARAIEAAHHIK